MEEHGRGHGIRDGKRDSLSGAAGPPVTGTWLAAMARTWALLDTRGSFYRNAYLWDIQ